MNGETVKKPFMYFIIAGFCTLSLVSLGCGNTTTGGNAPNSPKDPVQEALDKAQDMDYTVEIIETGNWIGRRGNDNYFGLGGTWTQKGKSYKIYLPPANVPYEVRGGEDSNISWTYIYNDQTRKVTALQHHAAYTATRIEAFSGTRSVVSYPAQGTRSGGWETCNVSCARVSNPIGVVIRDTMSSVNTSTINWQKAADNNYYFQPSNTTKVNIELKGPEGLPSRLSAINIDKNQMISDITFQYSNVGSVPDSAFDMPSDAQFYPKDVTWSFESIHRVGNRAKPGFGFAFAAVGETAGS